MPGVDRDGQLACVQRVEVAALVRVGFAVRSDAYAGAAQLLRRSRKAMVVVLVHPLDVDDLGAVVGQQPRRPRPDRLPGEIEHAYTAEDALRRTGRRAHRVTPRLMR